MVIFLFLISIFSFKEVIGVESSLTQKEKFELTHNNDLNDFKLLFPRYKTKIEKFSLDLSTRNVKEKRNKLKNILRIFEKEKNKFNNVKNEIKARLYFLNHVIELNQDLENYIFRIIKPVKGTSVKVSTFLRSNYQTEIPDHIMGRLGIRDSKENAKIIFSQWEKTVGAGNLLSYGHWVESNSSLDAIVSFNKNIKNRKIESLYSSKKFFSIDSYLVEEGQKSQRFLYNINSQGDLIFGFASKHPLFFKGFNHSHIANNFQILCAGTLQFDNNKIKYIDNLSGHYKPKEFQFQHSLKLLLHKNPEIFSKDCQVFVQGVSKPFSSLQNFLKQEFKFSFSFKKSFQDLLKFLFLSEKDAIKIGLNFGEEISNINIEFRYLFNSPIKFNYRENKKITLNEIYQKLKIMNEVLKLKSPFKNEKNSSFLGARNFLLISDKVIDDYIDKIFTGFPNIMNEKEEDRIKILRREILKKNHFLNDESFIDKFLGKVEKIFSDKGMLFDIPLNLFSMYKKFLNKKH